MKINVHVAFCVLVFLTSVSVAGIADHLLLSLDFSDSTALGNQTEASLPALNLISDMSPAKQTAGAVDFGTTGMLQGRMPGPEGAFSIETRFLIRAYAPNFPYISDLVSTGNWEGYPQQGMALSIGGGNYYPTLPKMAYSEDSLYSQSLGITGAQKASLSRCVVRFVFATLPGGTAQWLEAFTDRCVEPGVWNHLVAVWDGHAAHLYLNGKAATDIWRLNGAGSQPMLDSLSTVNVGARYHLSPDQRHLDGMMDYIRIVDTAMGESEIRKRYGQTLTEGSPESECRGSILPVSPAAGALCDGRSGFKLKLDSYGACRETLQAWLLDTGDSIEVEFSKSPDFLEPFRRITVPDTSFRLDAFLAGMQEVFSVEPCYWRVRLKPKAGGLAKRGGIAATHGWSDPKPFYFTYTSATVGEVALRPRTSPGLQKAAGGFLLTGWKGESAPLIFGLDGKTARITVTALPGGSWMLKPSENVSGRPRLYLLKSSERTVPLLFK